MPLGQMPVNGREAGSVGEQMPGGAMVASLASAAILPGTLSTAVTLRGTLPMGPARLRPLLPLRVHRPTERAI